MTGHGHREATPTERFPMEMRLLRPAEFTHVLAHGFRVRGKFLVIQILPNQLGCSRLGLTVARRVGSAPVRNRLRRRLRELFRRELRPLLDRRPEPVDVVMRAQATAGEATFAGLRAEALGAIDRWERRR